MAKPHNRKRGNRARRALRTEYQNDIRRVVSEDVIDCLTDIRHLCDMRGWSFGDLDRIAYGHYVAEMHEPADPAE